ncbi:Hypothetical Protein FCC1311_010582 [Hondaea fermentalgiana]|uniref:Transmembrane protein n=1 Tax=Hondaea fermentalgiana TaxID=2315210 RepID=A0A2R5G1G1_9STRA|nr:Hypothetical Protein FCC1311_010582 [Hondaea fermentalgiana]|eukprot:GBG24840.1 Hypothetical Protein FCC1311_010582 [Hondaea fermentalgiana]
MLNLGAVGRGATLLAGVLVVLVGLVHLFKILEETCTETPAMAAGTSSYECIGPSLRWNTDQAESPVADVNGQWRNVFTFVPDPFLLHWSPLILGLATISIHFAEPGWIIEAIAHTWFRLFLWLIFVALYGSFGYAGNMGIIVGFFLVFIAALALLIEVLFRNGQSPSTRMTLRAPDRLSECTPSPVTQVFSSIVIYGMPLVGFLTVILGVIVVIDRLPTICEDGYPLTNFESQLSCVGPGLIWIERTDTDVTVLDTTYSINTLVGSDDWGSFFSLRPSVFFDLLTPLLMGIISMLASLTSNVDSIMASWTLLSYWLLAQALFGNFGYGGNYGVVLGFLSSILSFCAGVVTWSKNPPTDKRARNSQSELSLSMPSCCAGSCCIRSSPSAATPAQSKA